MPGWTMNGLPRNGTQSCGRFTAASASSMLYIGFILFFVFFQILVWHRGFLYFYDHCNSPLNAGKLEGKQELRLRQLAGDPGAS